MAWNELKDILVEVLTQLGVCLCGRCPLLWPGVPKMAQIREDPTKIYICSFGHCPNSHWTPPPVKRALCGTNCRAKSCKCPFVHGHFSRCHKPSWQGFRPPPPNGQCPNEQRFFYGGASLNLGQFSNEGGGSSEYQFFFIV